MMDGKFDFQLIPEFYGPIYVVYWIEKVELFCRLFRIKQIGSVIPLHLTSGAFTIYQQLGEKEKSDAESIKKAVYMAFMTNSFWAIYDLVVTFRQICKCVSS